MVSSAPVRPWLIIDDGQESKEAETLFKGWCAERGHGCEVMRKDDVADVRAAPTLVWRGTYEGLELIRRILRSEHTSAVFVENGRRRLSRFPHRST